MEEAVTLYLLSLFDPPSGTTSIGTFSVNSGDGVSSITITNQGTGYVSAPVVTIAISTSGTHATAK